MGNQVLDAALEYATRGWPVFPCKPASAPRLPDGKADKRPLTKNGVLDATTNLDTIRKWWELWPEANVALDVGGAGMMVLDLDPGHDMKELEANVGKIPDTKLIQRTPRGGRHLFFNLAASECVPASASRLALHVDIRSFHSYVLLSPSATKDGAYVWESTSKPAHRTDEMVRVASSAREKHEDRDEWIIEPDLETNIRTATTWLATEAKPGIVGQGGDHCAYATAAMCKSFGISEALAFDLMWEHWCPRCSPPWDESGTDNLYTKIRNAYAYNTSPPGNLTPAYHAARLSKYFEAVKVVITEGDETKVGGFRFADRAALRNIKAPEWIIDDFIPDEAYAMLFGTWGTFKTFLALDLALRVAADPHPADELWTAPKQGPVLFAAGEGRSNIAKRIKAWEQVHCEGEEVSDFVLLDPVPLVSITEEALAALIDEALRRHPNGYLLTIIDTAGKAMGGENENAQEVASAFTALVGRLRAELGGSVLALHHTGHQEMSRARGSSVLGADPDTIVRADRQGKDYLVSLTMTKQKDAAEWDHPRYALLGEETLLEGGTTLVARLPAEEDLPEVETMAEALNLGILDSELSILLRSAPNHRWTQKDLAAALAMRDNVGFGEKRISQTYLTALRGENGTVASRCYNPMTPQKNGRWQWKDEDD